MQRRDFLKLLGSAPFTLALPPALRRLLNASAGTAKNVLIVLFDAWSASNVSLYGYGRQTTPNIDLLSKRAIVYRNHHASGNFTTPGTASILTGTYPWTHRAMRARDKTIDFFNSHNLFSLFGDYYRIAYTQNSWAQDVMLPMSGNIDLLPNVIDLYLEAPAIERLFPRDADTAAVSASRIASEKENYGYSLYLNRVLKGLETQSASEGMSALFPRGLPSRNDGVSAFTIETPVDWLVNVIAAAKPPFLSYFHLLPPHAPYTTRIEFVDRFKGDGFLPLDKPLDLFYVPPEHKSLEFQLGLQRRLYDEYLMYVDAEFARLYRILEASGVLENTWLILTSDHGEIFERGLIGHRTKTLYQPEIEVPLLIFEPGRKTGMAIQQVTSPVDLLPTLAYITGHDLPSWTEGTVLPPFSDASKIGERSIYALQAQATRPRQPITEATAASLRWPYKLQYYYGYEQLMGNELIKLYDLSQDREEMHDLATERPALAHDMLQDLQQKIRTADEPYQ